MATQGVVTITRGSQSYIKLVAGKDGKIGGMNLGRRLKVIGRMPTLREAYNLAIECGFGTPQTLVVMNRHRMVYDDHAISRVPRLYRATFWCPTFNPRWKYGIADYVKVIEL
ncbi:MAG TPA: hypothetical protein VJJ22_02665 [Candidatus Paceibacterota bacterium]